MAGGNDNYIGLAMGLDVSDLKSGLAETRKEITTANKTFSAQTSGLDDWSNSVEGLNAKLTQLDTVLKNQKKAVAGIQAELDHAKKKYGENSEQVRKLNDQLLDATASVGRTEKAQRKYTAQLERVQSGTKDTTSATGKMTKAFKDADRSTVDLKGGLSTLKVAMGNLISTGITSLVNGLKTAVQESREFRKEMAYLESGAKDAGVSFDDVQDKIRDIYSITEDQGAGVEGLNNLMTAGFKEDELDKITDALLGASIKWKDTLKFEGLSDGLQETMATGKAVGPFVELLERGGLVAEDFDAGLQACTTDAERQNYILKTLSDMGLSDIKDAYVENNKTLVDGAKATFDYSKAQADLGERVEPVLISVKQGFIDILNAFLDMYAGTDLTGLQTSIKNAFQWFIETCVPRIKQAIDFFMANWQPIVTAIGLIGGAFLAWKAVETVSNLTKAIKELDLSLIKTVARFAMDTSAKVANTVATTAQTVATKGATVAQRLLNLAMKANPILLIVSLIALLVTGFITLWNTSERFRNFWIGLWEKIKKIAKPVIDWLVKAFTKAWDTIKVAWSVVVAFFQKIWDGIKAVFSTLVTWFSNLFTNAWNAIKTAWNTVISFFSGIFNGIISVFTNIPAKIGEFFTRAWNKITGVFGNVKQWFQENVIDRITSVFTDLPSKMLQFGKDMINGLKNGVLSVAKNLKDAVVDTITAPIGWVKDKLGIHSPSRYMRDEIGKMMGEGVGVGLVASTKDVLKDANRFMQSVNSGLISKASGITNGLNGTIGNLAGAVPTSTVINNNYTQTINAPKQLSRIDLYRQTKNLLSYKGGY